MEIYNSEFSVLFEAIADYWTPRLNNNPVTSVTSNDIACNAGTSPVAAKCAVNAGSIVTVEMHQQPNDRSCANQAIGGAHYGPVQVYMAKVSDATTAVGASSGWFKVFADTWANTGSSGSSDAWGTNDLNSCCGKMDVKIPTDIAPVRTGAPYCFSLTVAAFDSLYLIFSTISMRVLFRKLLLTAHYGISKLIRTIGRLSTQG